MYRADSEAIPKSRRPRASIVLHGDGSATISTGGPDDRRIGASARWSREAGRIEVQLPASAGGPTPSEVRLVVEASAERLVLARPVPAVRS